MRLTRPRDRDGRACPPACARAVARGAVGALAAGAALAAMAGPAQAGTYDVVACNAAPGLNQQSFAPTASGGTSQIFTSTQDGCRPGFSQYGLRATGTTTAPALAVTREQLAAAPATEPRATWFFRAPNDTRIQRMTGTATCTLRPGWEAYVTFGGLRKTCTGGAYTFDLVPQTPQGSGGGIVISCFRVTSCSIPTTPTQSSFHTLTSATVRVGDTTIPRITVTNGSLPSGSVGHEALVVFDAADNVGIRESRLLIDGAVASASTETCDYTRSIPCPGLSGRAIAIPTAALAPGGHTWQVEVVDTAGNVGRTPAQPFTVDRQAPDVFLQGTLWEDRTVPLVPDFHDLAIDARSSEPGRATSGVARVEVLVDGGLRATFDADQPCTGAACEVDAAFELDAKTLAGAHTLTVRALDQAGHVRTVSWTVSFTASPTPVVLPTALTAPLAGESSAAASGCRWTTTPDARRLIEERPHTRMHGRWRSASGSGPETTDTYDEGRYRVTRCADDGRLVVSQLVGPVPVPGGTAMLELGRTVREGDAVGTSAIDYLDPDDPLFRRAWPKVRDAALADVLPKTR